MKIGLVLSETPGYSETFFMSKIKGLQAKGHEVVLFVQSNPNKFNACRVKLAYPIFKRNKIAQLCWFVLVFFKLMVRFRTILRFLKLEKQENVSVFKILKKAYTNGHILTQKIDWLHFGFATMALGKEHVAEGMGAKMATSLRGFDIAIYPIKHPHCYDLLWKRVDKVHTISDDLYQLAIKNGLSPTVPFQKITPAIDTSYFIKKTSTQINLNMPVSILTVARLHWKKGLMDTLLALKLLKDKGLLFRYTIVGEGEQFEALSYIIYSLNLTEEVSLVGKKSREDIKTLLETHDIYIQYSISEGFCNAVLEAQAMGLLCVVSDAEGLPENVLHEQTGWVVPKRAPEKLVKQLETIVNLPVAQKNDMINKAVQRVKSDFNLEQQQEAFIEFYTNP